MSEGFDYWDFFRRECKRANDAPLYLDIVTGIGRDDDLKELASHVKPGQPMANIILAAVHFLLLRGADHPLRTFYPNLNGGVRRDGHAFPLFKDFVNAHRGEVDALIRKGVTNTNEVARSSSLHAGFRAVEEETGEPLSLIEIGPSAGLNTIWDRYRVRYTRGEEAFYAGPEDAALTIDCELRGEKNPPFGPAPKVASRIGLELNPVDPDDPYWRDWLKALVWPDQIARFARLQKAIDIFREEKVEIRTGNALDLLPDALACIPEDLPVCVYHTYVTYQFSHEMREALDNILAAAGLRHPIWRLAMEAEPKDGEWTNWLTLSCYRDGMIESRKLAKTHPHGAWLEWLA